MFLYNHFVLYGCSRPNLDGDELCSKQQPKRSHYPRFDAQVVRLWRIVSPGGVEVEGVGGRHDQCRLSLFNVEIDSACCYVPAEIPILLPVQPHQVGFYIEVRGSILRLFP